MHTQRNIVRGPQDSRAPLFINRHRRTPSYPYDYRAHARRHTPPPEVGAGRMRKLRRGLAGEKHNTVFERPNQRPASPRQPMENPRVGQEGRSHYLNRARFKGSQSYFPAGVDDSRCAPWKTRSQGTTRCCRNSGTAAAASRGTCSSCSRRCGPHRPAGRGARPANQGRQGGGLE